MRIADKKKEGRSLQSSANFQAHADPQQRYDYVPIDWLSSDIINLSTSSLEARIETLNLPDYETKNRRTGTVHGHTAEYKSCKIRIIEAARGGYHKNFQGSIHRLANNGGPNYDLFTPEKFEKAMNMLYTDFGIKPENLQIKSLEVGVNIRAPIDPATLINHCFSHKRKDIEQQISSDKGKFHQAEHNKYILKIYDKGKQYGLNLDILRLEIKYKNWSIFRTSGIDTLQDFINADKTFFVEDLVKRWEEVIFFDPTISDYSTQHKYNNRLFWQSQAHKHRNTYTYHKNQLRQLCKAKGNDIQSEVSTLIKKALSNDYHSISTLRKKCLYTGIDISMQRSDSKLLSHTGIRHLMKENPEAFDQLKEIYLPNHWAHSSESVVIRELAHTIRNRYNYKRKRHLVQIPTNTIVRE